ncbi:MAG: molybdenum cofactor biosynthesis protein MoaE [Acidobacteriaceae bacterium]
MLEHWVRRTPDAREYLGSVAVAVNREYAAPTQVLCEGDEVALLPPVSGGCAGDAAALVRLQREPIEPATLLAQLKHGADGAVVIFDGVVRDNTCRRRTLYLDYEAYEEMAIQQMRALVKDAKTRFDVRELALVHRLGRLEIGESSVWIAVASAHRAAAFEACRFVIDTLKKTVPIWKKESFEDGAVWSDGEPFPAEIAVRGVADRMP